MKRDRQRQAFLGWLGAVLMSAAVGLLLLLAVPGTLAQSTVPYFSRLAPVCIYAGVVMIIAAAVLLLAGAVVWAIRHKLHYGIRYALRHAWLVAHIRRALFETEGAYAIRQGSELVTIPRVRLELSRRDLLRGKVALSNHIKFDSALSKLNLSPALGRYVTTRSYQSPTGNAWVFEFADATTVFEQITFETPDALYLFAEKAPAYHLRLDAHTTVPLTTTVISGTVGSGKSYYVFYLLLSLLHWDPPPIIYFADKKRSGLNVAGRYLCPSRTANSIEGIIALLEEFSEKMEERKAVMAGKLDERLDGSYSDWELPPIIFMFEELAAFMVALDKKEAERVNRVLREVVLEGRQLGVFLFMVMQKTDSTTLPTAIRDNTPLKVCLGNAPDTTYVTLFEHTNVPNFDYKTGQGVYSLFESVPDVLAAPTMKFDPGVEFKRLGQLHDTTTSAPPPCEAKGGGAPLCQNTSEP
ncbi:MAG: hypothetical protein NC319_05880 [Butyricicoccus sp.]|nr:hypothetical protein [Butyricicoccus sp.]